MVSPFRRKGQDDSSEITDDSDLDDAVAENEGIAIEEEMNSATDVEAVSYTHLTLPTICSV